MLYLIDYSQWTTTAKTKWRKLCLIRTVMISYILEDTHEYGYYHEGKYVTVKKGDYIYYDFRILSIENKRILI